MPYISSAARRDFDWMFHPERTMEMLGVEPQLPTNPGELNYVISRLIDNYIRTNGVSYDNFNALMGVLGCIKMEMYRRFVAPYETYKNHENGEVFEEIKVTFLEMGKPIALID